MIKDEIGNKISIGNVNVRTPIRLQWTESHVYANIILDYYTLNHIEKIRNSKDPNFNFKNIPSYF
ncbi:MAG: hypothetical protein P0116_14910 [Candidatus Nitrosocosmicus sp.]|nr:hypothetical protein [Candidatus Nitrosocosmicus sp.]